MPPSSDPLSAESTLLLDAIHGVHESVNEVREKVDTAIRRSDDHDRRLREIEERHRQEDEEKSKGADRRLQDRHPLIYKFAEIVILVILSALTLRCLPHAGALLGNLIG